VNSRKVKTLLVCVHPVKLRKVLWRPEEKQDCELPLESQLCRTMQNAAKSVSLRTNLSSSKDRHHALGVPHVLLCFPGIKIITYKPESRIPVFRGRDASHVRCGQEICPFAELFTVDNARSRGKIADVRIPPQHRLQFPQDSFWGRYGILPRRDDEQS